MANQFAGAAVNIGVVEHFNDDNIIIYEDMGEQLTDILMMFMIELETTILREPRK